MATLLDALTAYRICAKAEAKSPKRVSVVYFSNLQRLGWVEFTGREEPSAFQDHYPPGPPRRYYRLTNAGGAASDAAWSDPLFALYGES